jgi:hypothetical protein
MIPISLVKLGYFLKGEPYATTGIIPVSALDPGAGGL